MNHYVYLLQHPTDRLKYIGVRSCKCTIEQDPYKSSSKSVTKQYLSECTKTILKVFTTRKEAVEYEIYLHNLYDVAKNPEYFNCAKQTATKFDQSGKIFSNLNPNAKIIDIYNHLDELQFSINGDITKMKKEIPRNAFMRSYKQKGKPLGSSKQSRIELRKNMFQHFIGWYALIRGQKKTSTVVPDCDIELEQRIGLFCKARYSTSKDKNPNAKIYTFFDAENKKVCKCFGDFDFTLTKLGIPRGLGYAAAKSGAPVKTRRKKYLHLNGWTIIKKEQHDY